MKLAEALMERADVQKRIDQMAARLSNNAKVQEDEAPAEAPEALLDELAALVARQEALVTSINLKNSATTVEGESLTALLAREVERRGALPFYGTAMSHIASQKVALRAGFEPAWTELYAERMEEHKES